MTGRTAALIVAGLAVGGCAATSPTPEEALADSVEVRLASIELQGHAAAGERNEIDVADLAQVLADAIAPFSAESAATVDATSEVRLQSFSAAYVGAAQALERAGRDGRAAALELTWTVAVDAGHATPLSSLTSDLHAVDRRAVVDLLVAGRFADAADLIDLSADAVIAHAHLDVVAEVSHEAGVVLARAFVSSLETRSSS